MIMDNPQGGQDQSDENAILASAKTRLDAFHSVLSSDSRTTASLHALRIAIRSDLDATEAMGLEFSELLNACAPISSLPVEILCIIFELVAQEQLRDLLQPALKYVLSVRTNNKPPRILAM